MNHTAVYRVAPTPVSGDDYDLMHIVGAVQHWLDRLGLKVPRALCGELLVGDPDRPDPGETGAPVCPRCAEIAGLGGGAQ
jgi:hypothetical protein